MIAELISVGTELLLGNIVNTNAAFLSEQCARLGLLVYHQQVVGDNAGRLSQAIETALLRADIVILSGGLGPTEDDLTKEVAAEVMNSRLVEDCCTKERIRDYFQGREIAENNWKQALVPEGCIVVANNNGTAPGIIIEKENKSVILLPGPPGELIPMFKEYIKNYLVKRQPYVLFSQMVKICGVGESMAETKILDLIHAQSNPTIATYAKTGEVHIRITAKAENLERAKELTEPVVQELQNRFKEDIYSIQEEDTLEDVVVKTLIEKKLQISTVESCTGGLLAGRLVNASGVSEVLKEGFVTYSNQAKMKLVHVDKETVERYGVVSKETAEEMARGACKEASADIGVSVTGVAGPGTEENKPVGLIYIGCCFKGQVVVKEYHFHGNRQTNREQAVIKALDLVRRCLLSC